VVIEGRKKGAKSVGYDVHGENKVRIFFKLKPLLVTVLTEMGTDTKVTNP